MLFRLARGIFGIIHHGSRVEAGGLEDVFKVPSPSGGGLGWGRTLGCSGMKYTTTAGSLRVKWALETVFPTCVGIGRDLSAWPRRVGAHSRARQGTCARVCAGENCAGTGGQGARLCAPTWEYQHALRIPWKHPLRGCLAIPRNCLWQVPGTPSFLTRQGNALTLTLSRGRGDFRTPSCSYRVPLARLTASCARVRAGVPVAPLTW